jgi:hypothetical protein
VVDVEGDDRGSTDDADDEANQLKAPTGTLGAHDMQMISFYIQLIRNFSGS